MPTSKGGDTSTETKFILQGPGEGMAQNWVEWAQCKQLIAYPKNWCPANWSYAQMCPALGPFGLPGSINLIESIKNVN